MFCRRGFMMNKSLDDMGIAIGGNDPAFYIIHGGRKSEGEGYKPGLGTTVMHELLCLGNVFTEDEFWFELVIEAGAAQDGDSDAAVRSMLGIGDGDFLDAGIEERFQAGGGIERRIGRKPEHEASGGIDLQRIRIGESCVDQFLRVDR